MTLTCSTHNYRLEYAETIRAALLVFLWRHEPSNRHWVIRDVRQVFGSLEPLSRACKLGLVEKRFCDGKLAGYDTTPPADFVLARQFPQYLLRALHRPGNREKLAEALLAYSNRGTAAGKSGGNGRAFMFVPGAESFERFRQRVIISMVEECGSQKKAAQALGISERIVSYWCHKQLTGGENE